MHGESRIATSAFSTMGSCDASVLTPSRKSSIAVLSPRFQSDRRANSTISFSANCSVRTNDSSDRTAVTLDSRTR